MFDYTCDEDMLPENHLDDPRINDLETTNPIDFEEVPF